MLTKKITKSEKRVTELDHLIKRIYEDNVSGKLTDKRFEMLSADYEKEQAELEEFLTTAREQLATAKEEASNVDKFISLIHRYTDFSELTTPMIHEFIDRIEVHEADKSTGAHTGNRHLSQICRQAGCSNARTDPGRISRRRTEAVANVRGIEPTTDAKLRKNVLKKKQL